MMKQGTGIYLVTGSTDIRKSIDAISIIVSEYGADPFEPALYVCCNKNRNRLKILSWVARRGIACARAYER